MLYEKYDKDLPYRWSNAQGTLKSSKYIALAESEILCLSLIWSLVWASANAHHLHDARSGPDRDAPDRAVSGWLHAAQSLRFRHGGVRVRVQCVWSCNT